MKTAILKVLTGIGLLSLLSGCMTPTGEPDYTGSGALIGGASGATLGALADEGAPGAGALIGGAAGVIAGGLIGHSMDQQAQAARSAPPPAYYNSPPATAAPSVEDVKAMTRAGVSEDVIIQQINNTHAVYHLDANAIIDLKNSGVSQKVIAAMINTATPVVAPAPPPPQPEPVVVAPGPGYVWMNGEWVWSGGAWVWVGGRWVLPPYPQAVWVRGYWWHGPRGWYRRGGHWR
jgi:Glycine zipper/WXXGXW repeat (2 copies)